MRKKTSMAAACFALFLSAVPAGAQDQKCRHVAGNATWTLIASPGDPLGRVLGPATGDLKAAISAYLTALTPQADGSLKATSVETWVLGAQDTLTFAGTATFTPLAGQPTGTFHDALHLTVSSGTGKYADATGTIEVRGIGYNIVGPAAGPGNSFFAVRYEGDICRAQ
jgi:hypothetical protein